MSVDVVFVDGVSSRFVAGARTLVGDNVCALVGDDVLVVDGDITVLSLCVVAATVVVIGPDANVVVTELPVVGSVCRGGRESAHVACSTSIIS